MPLRTINDSFFQWTDSQGRLLTATRGQTVDIPDGVDLDRGDRFGAFTVNPGDEVLPPDGSFLPPIEPEWTDEEFIRYIDAGQHSEILTGLEAFGPVERVAVAQRLLAAEEGRGEGKIRTDLVTVLAAIGGVTTNLVPPVVTPVSVPGTELPIVPVESPVVPLTDDDGNGVIDPADELPPGDPDRPTDRAHTATWVAYAISRGVPEDEAKNLSREELIARFSEA